MTLFILSTDMKCFNLLRTHLTDLFVSQFRRRLVQDVPVLSAAADSVHTSNRQPPTYLPKHTTVHTKQPKLYFIQSLVPSKI